MPTVLATSNNIYNIFPGKTKVTVNGDRNSHVIRERHYA